MAAVTMAKLISATVLAMVAVLATMVSPAMGISGTATFYTPPYTPSACFGNAAEGTMIAAASEVFWDGGAACGDKYVVTCTGATNQGVPHPCTGRSVTVRIVDLCPAAGCRGTIDLSQEAFAVIADPDAGKIKIDYRRRDLWDASSRNEFRSLACDACSPAAFEAQWHGFMARHRTAGNGRSLDAMHGRRELWAAAEFVHGRFFFGMASDQRTGCLATALHTGLHGGMSLPDLLEHADTCAQGLRYDMARLEHLKP